jgi:hypothetical protein
LTDVAKRPGHHLERVQRPSASSAPTVALLPPLQTRPLTRFVIGDDTLSSTSVFNFSHCAIRSTAIKSCISGPFNGHYLPLGHYLVHGGNIKTKTRQSATRWDKRAGLKTTSIDTGMNLPADNKSGLCGTCFYWVRFSSRNLLLLRCPDGSRNPKVKGGRPVTSCSSPRRSKLSGTRRAAIDRSS